MSDEFSLLWTEAGVVFDLTHPDLPPGWTSTRYHCTDAVGLKLPQPVGADDHDASMARREWVFSMVGTGRRPVGGRPARLQLFVGDRVEVDSVASIKGRVPDDHVRHAKLIVRHADGCREKVSAPAVFWPSDAITAARAVRSRLGGISLAYAAAASQQLAPADALSLRVAEDAWAWAGYEAARHEYQQALAEATKAQTSAAHAASRQRGDPYRRLAGQFLYDKQLTGGTRGISPDAAAQHVLQALTETGDPASGRNSKTVRDAILELFEKRGGRYHAKRIETRPA